MSEHISRAGFLFCGLGAGARGFLESRVNRDGHTARFVSVGGIDNDPLACADFEKLTGTPGTVADLAAMQPRELVDVWGPVAPDVVFLSPPCLPGHEHVLTAEGSRPIDEVRAGDLVLSHRGRYRPVLKVGSHLYTGQIYGFRLNGTVEMRQFTAEHPLWRRRVVRAAGSRAKKRSLGPAEFVPASEVRVGDRIGFPVENPRKGCVREFVVSFGDPQMVVRGGTRTGRYAKPRHEAWLERVADLRPHAESEALWFLLGVYLGDGYRRAACHEVIFCVGALGGELHRRVDAALTALGLKCYVDDDGGDTNVKLRTSSKHLCAIAGAFGDSAEAKTVPEQLMHMENEQLKWLFDGYFAADGSAQDVRSTRRQARLQPRRKIASVSLPLLRSFQRLLLRLGEFWCINKCWPGGEQTIMGRRVQTLPRFELVHRADAQKRSVAEFIDGAVWVRVREIGTRAAKERVWNLEVFEDDTFCVHLMATHNCKGFSGLLSKAAASAEKYQTMNRLLLQGLFLVCEAWSKPPPLIVVENVPRIATRGAHLLTQVRSMLSTYGFRFHEANHDCGEIGGLAQRRRRFLLVARRPEAVKSFVYKPPKQRVRACGEVLGQLPLPEDPAAGALHKLPRISWLNWVRLALIPAGGDWRDLPGVVPEGKQRRSVFARYDVRGWDQEARTVAGDGTNGGYAVVDPRVGLDHEPRRGALGVIDWTDPSCTVRGRADVRTGPAAVVDPRLGPKEGDWHHGVCGVQPWDQPAGTVTGGAAVTTGRFSVADPRIADMNKIGWGSYQNQCVVLGWDDPARTITSATRVCSGAPSIADPRAFAGGYGVLDWEKPSGVVTGELYPSTGRGSVADPRIGAGAVHGPNAHWNKYKVADWTAPASTVIGGMTKMKCRMPL